MAKILVFPCGSEIGLEIHNALKHSRIIELFGGASVESNHGRYVYRNYCDTLPFVNDNNFLTEINSFIASNKIDMIFPAHDSVVLKLAENYDRLLCKVIGSPLETCRICRSKKNTYSVFQGKLEVPKFILSEADYRFPLFLKPDVGQGSKGTVKVNTKEELEFFLSRDPALLVLEYLPGDEYTIDCFTDRHGNLLYSGARTRHRISNGISVDTTPVVDSRFSEIAKIINDTLVFRGAWFFQLKERESGELVLLEIAPRIAGSMGLHRNIGVNMAMLGVLDTMDIDVQVRPNTYNIRMDRALGNKFWIDLEYDDVYLDLDDTIIRNDQVDSMVMAFVWQCINRGKRVHLLSKHVKDIKLTLERYRLKDVFDTITVIGRGESKADYIRSKSAIFIDDSFSERQSVAKKAHIPTFDPSALECLLDWRY